MANRHLSRSVVLQTLFECDFRRYETDIATEALVRNAHEFAPGVSETAFMESLLKNVIAKQSTLDEIIVKAAPDWPMEKISIVDRNVLRLGLYEVLFADRGEVPPKVAINEAIELAKTFGGETSGKFVNGVLGAVYKEIGEPGKDEITKPKKKNNKGEGLDLSKIPLQKLGGAVVYSVDQDKKIRLAFVHDIFGHWTLSKGKIDENEDVQAGTIREIKEEMGIDVIIEETLQENEYIASHPEKGKTRKHVHYFLAKGEYAPLTLGESGGLDNAKWFPIDDVMNLNMYDDISPIVQGAIERIKKQASS